jgi:dTDP-4-dehydrorhamnose reductase
MKVLLFGKTGQLGWELQRTLQPLGEVVALDYPEINMADAANIRKMIRQHRPNIIVNATAYTAVDKAESESELAHAINATGPGVLAEESHELNALLVHYSTDYVFDGTKGTPYVETDSPNPLSVYGKSKLGGEQAIQAVGGAYLILRTAWVYSTRRDSFVSKVLQWARQNENLKIVSDQVSNPTWARMLAEITTLVIAKPGPDFAAYFREKYGVYHLAGIGYTSRFEWAQAILENDPQKDQQIVRTLETARTEDFPTPAERPLFSALDCTRFEKTFGLRLPEWQETLALAMK